MWMVAFLSMRALNLQFFLLFGSFAAVQPYLALLFKERGMDEERIGYAMGISGWAIMLSPALIAFIADTKVQPRRLVTVLSVLTAAALGALLWAQTFVLLTVFYFLYSLVVTAMIPLQDGVVFGYQKMQRETGVPEVHYNAVRVWGTYGYMALLMALFFPLMWWGRVEVAILFGIGCVGLLVVNSFALPDRGRRETAKRAQRLPTSEAVATLFTGRAIAFSGGMFLFLAASAAYHTMYPVYLAEDLGLAKHWVGIVIMSGGMVEVFFIHALSRWERRWGMRTLMLAGALLTVLRFALMYGFPNLAVAIGSQLFHGPMICAMMVLPPVYINTLAQESNRNSMQGVYTMMVIGVSRFVGTALSGHVAAVGQREVYLLCSMLTLGAVGLLAVGLRKPAQTGHR